MVFGLSSPLRFLCIDVQVDQVYFVVVRRAGDFFQIDFTKKVIFEDGVFELGKMRAPGRFGDVLLEIKKKFGPLQTIATIPENFCYATLLTGEDYLLSLDVKNAAKAFSASPTYVWKHSFTKNKHYYTALHVAEKQICDFVFSLVKNSGFKSVVVYPRILALTELNLPLDTMLCDFGPNQTTMLTSHNSHTIGFSTVSYGSQDLAQRIQKRFSANEKEITEIFESYGTDVLLRKDAHILNGLVYAFFVPIVDEMHSLELRRSEYGFVAESRLVAVGDIAKHNGLIEDLSNVTRTDSSVLNVWENVIDFDSYIPEIHKKDSYQYAGIAGLMNVLKKGTRYEPFDVS